MAITYNDADVEYSTSSYTYNGDLVSTASATTTDVPDVVVEEPRPPERRQLRRRIRFLKFAAWKIVGPLPRDLTTAHTLEARTTTTVARTTVTAARLDEATVNGRPRAGHDIRRHVIGTLTETRDGKLAARMWSDREAAELFYLLSMRR